MPFVLSFLWLLNRKKAKSAVQDAATKDIEICELSEKVGQLVEKLELILSIEEEAEQLRKAAEKTQAETVDLQKTYAEKREVLKKLEQQVAVYDERLSFSELGVYEPHFDFGDSEVFKESILKARLDQKEMISQKSATLDPGNMTLDGSIAKGRTMMNRQIRLTMRAFNNECEAAIANARWNNVNAMEKRILNSAKQINSANASVQLSISEAYVALKLDELHLTHEYRERLKIEKDERADLARAEREEKKLLAEAEAAEREEQRYSKLLDKARKEAGADESRISELEAALAEAQKTGERARAMAEMTKSGYVYIISNIGSFGEDVIKIGLTRRLEPDDRVRELGDASVPFTFDTHAMIYSEEAPALESALHNEFSERRVNAANMRKEFFRVTLDEVEQAVKKLAPEANFFTDREAQDWHETLQRRKEALTDMQRPSDEFPDEI
jgi:vacuolar-type H+-ATPase subunit I/STV1